MTLKAKALNAIFCILIITLALYAAEVIEAFWLKKIVYLMIMLLSVGWNFYILPALPIHKKIPIIPKVLNY